MVQGPGPKSSLTITSSGASHNPTMYPQTLPQTSCSTSGVSKLRNHSQAADQPSGPRRRLVSTKAGDSEQFKQSAQAVLDNVVYGSAIGPTVQLTTTNAIIQGQAQSMKTDMATDHVLQQKNYDFHQQTLMQSDQQRGSVANQKPPRASKSEFEANQHSLKPAKQKSHQPPIYQQQFQAVGMAIPNDGDIQHSIQETKAGKKSLVFNSPDIQRKNTESAYVSGSTMRKNLPEFSPLLELTKLQSNISSNNGMTDAKMEVESLKANARIHELTVASERRAHSLAQTAALGAAQILPTVHGNNTRNLNNILMGSEYRTEDMPHFDQNGHVQGLITLQPKGGTSEQQFYECNPIKGAKSSTVTSKLPKTSQGVESRAHNNSHLNMNNYNPANIEILPNSAAMSAAAKTGEMQMPLLGSEVIDNHLRQKPQFNFACPTLQNQASQISAFNEARPMNSNQNNQPQLQLNLANKQAPADGEFMSQHSLVSPASKGPTISNQYHNAYRTQASSNSENKQPEMLLGSISNSQAKGFQQNENQQPSSVDVSTDGIELKQSIVQKKANQFKQYVSEATKRTSDQMIASGPIKYLPVQNLPLQVGNNVMVIKNGDFPRQAHASDLLKNNFQQNPTSTRNGNGIHSRRDSDKRTMKVSTSQNPNLNGGLTAGISDYNSADPAYQRSMQLQMQSQEHANVHKFFSPDSRYSVTTVNTHLADLPQNLHSAAPLLKRIDYIPAQNGQEQNSYIPQSQRKQQAPTLYQVMSDHKNKAAYMKQQDCIVKEAEMQMAMGSDENTAAIYHSMNNQHLTLGGPLVGVRQPPLRPGKNNRSPLVVASKIDHGQNQRPAMQSASSAQATQLQALGGQGQPSQGQSAQGGGGKEMPPHFYPPNFRMQGHHFNNLANKRNRVTDENNQLPTGVGGHMGAIQRQSQAVPDMGGISMALTGQRILGREQDTSQQAASMHHQKIRQRISLDTQQQNQHSNYGLQVTSPRGCVAQPDYSQDGNQRDDGIMNSRMLRINNIGAAPVRGPDVIPQNHQNFQPDQTNNTNPSQMNQTGGTAKAPQPTYHFIYDYLFVQVSKQQFEREYAPKLALRENPNANYLMQLQYQRMHSPDVAHTYVKQGCSPRDMEKRGQALQALLTAAERRQQKRNANFNSPVSTPSLMQVSGGGASPRQQDMSQRTQPESAYSQVDQEMVTPRELQEDESEADDPEKHLLAGLTVGEKLSAVLLETQFEGLKVLHSEKVLNFMKQLERQEGEMPQSLSGVQLQVRNKNLPLDEEKILNNFVNDVTAKLHEQNKRFKVTIKKKYVNEILLQSKGAQNLAQFVVLIVCNNISQLVGKNNEELKQRITKKRDRSKEEGDYGSESDNQSNSKNRANMPENYLKSLSMRKQNRGRRDINTNLGPEGKQTPQMNPMGPSVNGRRAGYESESDIMAAKSSLNSTTTSSTLPQYLGSLLQGKDRKNGGQGGLSTPKKNNCNMQNSQQQIPLVNGTQVQQRGQFNPKMANRSLSYIGASNIAQQRDSGQFSTGQGQSRSGQRDGGPAQQQTSGGDSVTDLHHEMHQTQQQRELSQQEIKVLMEQRTLKFKDYGPCKIKKRVNTEALFRHFAHPINIMIRDYNDFVRLVFKAMTRADRLPKVSDITYALKLAKRLGLQINKNHLSLQFLKVRENSNAVKEKLIQFICRVMQKENDFTEHFPGQELFKKSTNMETAQYIKMLRKIKEPRTPYKFYVGKGNNATMVRTLLKARFWWQLHDKEDIDKVNFMWTQLRKNAVMTSLKCKLNKKSKQAKNVEGQQSPPTKLKGTSSLRVSGSNPRRQVRSAHPGSHKQIEDETNETTEDDENMTASRLANSDQTVAFPNQQGIYPVKIYNKLEDNYHLSNKKALFINVKNYYEAIGEDPFAALPITFHVKTGLHDPEIARFKKYYLEAAAKERKDHNIWIIKPGECTNQGFGIQVAQDLQEIIEMVETSTRNSRRTCIVQKYIHNPLLISKRKFDIRTYAMLTSLNGNLKGYEYEEGYLRTSCTEYSIKNLSNKMVHLTNDAIQKKSDDYGKFEPGNKMGYEEFQRYLDKTHASLNVCFERDILPQIKKLTADCFRAVWGKIDPNRRLNTFECYGLDFMIDDDFKVYLIEVNTNPCLELSSPLLARLIPAMLDNALRLVVDPLFPPPENFSQRKQVVNELCPENKFELVFDERVDGPHLAELLREKENVIVEIDEEELSDAENEENDKNNRLCEEDLIAGSIE